MKKKSNIIAGSVLLLALMAGCGSGNGNSNNTQTPNQPTPPTGPISYAKIEAAFSLNPQSSLQDANVLPPSCSSSINKTQDGMAVASGFLSLMPFGGEALGLFGNGLNLSSSILSTTSLISSCSILQQFNQINQVLQQQQNEINNIESALSLSDNDIWNGIASTDAIETQTASALYNSALDVILGNGVNTSLFMSTYSAAGFYDNDEQQFTNYTLNDLLSESTNLNTLQSTLSAYGNTVVDNLNSATGAYVPQVTCDKQTDESGVLVPACYLNVAPEPTNNLLLPLLTSAKNLLVTQMTADLESNTTPNVIPLLDDYNNALGGIYQQGLAAIQQAYQAEYMINYINYYQKTSSNPQNIILPDLLKIPGTYYNGTNDVSYIDAQKYLSLYAAAMVNQLYRNIAGYIVTDGPVGGQFYPSESYTINVGNTSYIGEPIPYQSIVGAALVESNINTAVKLVNYALVQSQSSVVGNPYPALANNLATMNLVYYQYQGLINIAEYATILESYNAVNGANGNFGNALQSMESLPNLQIFTDVNGNPVNQSIFTLNTIQPYVINQNGPLLTGSVTNNVSPLACNGQAVGNVPAWNMYFYTPNSNTSSYPSLGVANTPYLMCGNWLTEPANNGASIFNVSNQNTSGYSYLFDAFTSFSQNESTTDLYFLSQLMAQNGSAQSSSSSTINFLNPASVMNLDNIAAWSAASSANLSNGTLYSSIISTGGSSTSTSNGASKLKYPGEGGFLVNNIALQTTMPDGFIAPFGISMTQLATSAGWQRGPFIGISPNPNVIVANVMINGKPIYDNNNILLGSNSAPAPFTNLAGSIPYTSLSQMYNNYPWLPVYSTNPALYNTLGDLVNQVSALGVNGWLLIPNGDSSGTSTVCITNPNTMQGQSSSSPASINGPKNNGPTPKIFGIITPLGQLTTNPCYDNYYRINTNPNAVPGSTLGLGASLYTQGTSTMISPNGISELVMQSDGNLVVYKNGASVWASGTAGSGATYMALGGDGNLGVYTESGLALWKTNTSNKGVNYLAVGDDGDLGLYTQSGATVWKTGT